MSLSTPRAPQGRSIVGKIVLALIAASVMVGISMGPALSADNNRRSGPQERDQRAYQPYQRAHQPARHARQPARRGYQPYGYYPAPPVVYAPPPVVYAPPPSPGISLFFDLPIRIR